MLRSGLWVGLRGQSGEGGLAEALVEEGVVEVEGGVL